MEGRPADRHPRRECAASQQSGLSTILNRLSRVGPAGSSGRWANHSASPILAANLTRLVPSAWCPAPGAPRRVGATARALQAGRVHLYPPEAPYPAHRRGTNHARPRGHVRGRQGWHREAHCLINEAMEQAVYPEMGDRTPDDKGNYPDDELKPRWWKANGASRTETASLANNYAQTEAYRATRQRRRSQIQFPRFS